MQVFIVGTPLATATFLDWKRLNKQVVECHQMLDAMDGKKAWSNHPCVLQYRGYEEWLREYRRCLSAWKNNDELTAFVAEQWCHQTRPPFHTQEYFDQMKRRLYTKDKLFYKQWAHLGESEDNWYFVDGAWRVYNNGKRLK